MNQLTTEGTKSVRNMLATNQLKFQSALGKAIHWEYFLRCAMSQIENTPKLLECSQTSLLAALLTSAQLRLVPDGQLGQAYLIPYGDKVQFIAGYRGLITLVRRSGEVKDITARAVYTGDKFNFSFGTASFIEHVPTEKDRGKFRAAYAVVEYKDGGSTFEVMFANEINEHRDRYSKAAGKKESPWNTAYDEMAKKTVVRRMVKYLPLSTEDIPRLLINEESFEATIDTGDGPVIDIGDDDKGSAVDSLVNKIKKKVDKPSGNGNGAVSDDEQLLDSRIAINDYLNAVYGKNKKAKSDKLKLYISQADPDFAGEIPSVEKLPDDLVLPILDLVLNDS